MTTAARPTWAPAKGGNEQGGTRIFGPSGKYSSRDLAAHTSLKPRKEGQHIQEELQKRNLRDELEERERRHYSSKDKPYSEERDRRKNSSLLLEGYKRDAEDKIVPREIDADDSDVEPGSDDERDETTFSGYKRDAEDKIVPREIDADDSDVEPGSDDESDEDDDDDDDTEALMAELERIKKERAEEKNRKERQQAEEEAKMKEEELMRGTPLININNAGSFSVKRRWDEDVVLPDSSISFLISKLSLPRLQFLRELLRSLCLLLLTVSATVEARHHGKPAGGGATAQSMYLALSCREHTASLADFGGVGDGTTSNTAAFRSAVEHLSQYSGEGGGGGMLYVPPGKWLTGPFNLTSHFTLFLHSDAVILGSQDMGEWPVVDPLPSYGRGRDKIGGRYASLIGGSNLTNVAITGDNGTIDGQGAMWWSKFHGNKLKYTRGYLIEVMHSDTVFIANVTLVNSPAWNIHPVYSSNIVVQWVTILAPTRSPNTDGINPDSCSHVRIEDCYIVSGDDCVAIKSGWDEYGIAYGMPSEHIVIRRLTCVSPTSAVIALGSEMSGGIRDVRAEDIAAVDSESGVRIKTAVGRGAYVRDVFVRGMRLDTMKWVFWMTGNYKSHPDDKYDPAAVPVVDNISYQDVVATGVRMPARLEGIQGAPFRGICIANVTAQMDKPRKYPWTCTDVEGVSAAVTPPPCQPLQGAHVGACPFPTDTLPIDQLTLQRCSYSLLPAA